jgi:hypothetical protein
MFRIENNWFRIEIDMLHTRNKMFHVGSCSSSCSSSSLREFVLATRLCFRSPENVIRGGSRTGNGALAAEWRCPTLAPCSARGLGELFDMSAHSRRQVVHHGAECTGALAWEWCTARTARMLSRGSGARRKVHRNAPAFLCGSGGWRGLHGRSRVEVVHGTECT